MISSASQGRSSSRESLPLKGADTVQARETGEPISPEKKNGSDASLPFPKTPSMNRNSAFENATFPMFQTPEKTPMRQINREAQPRGGEAESAILLSPPGVTSPGSRKRRSNDFYSLLKSPRTPQRSRPVSIEEGEIRRLEEAERAKRPVDVENVKSEFSSPEKRGSGNYEYSLSPRLDRNTNVKRISENLKTRLNYAKAKIQHGWSDKSLAEVREQLDIQKKDRILKTDEKVTYDEFWKTPGDTLPRYEKEEKRSRATHGTLLTPRTPRTPKKSHILSKSHVHQRSITLDEVASNHRKAGSQHGASGSAERALFEALSPRTPRHAPPNIPPPPVSGSPVSETRLEQDAIMSLMTLATPKDKSRRSPYSSMSSSPQKVHLPRLSPELLRRHSPEKDTNVHHQLGGPLLPPPSPSKSRNFAGAPASGLYEGQKIGDEHYDNGGDDDDDDDVTEVETSDEDETRLKPPTLDSRLVSSPISRTLPPLQASPRFSGGSQLVGLGLGKASVKFGSMHRKLPASGTFGQGKRSDAKNGDDEDEDRTLSEDAM